MAKLSSKLSNRRKIFYSLAPALAMLIALELLLRLVNFESSALDPFESFVAHSPLFSEQGDDYVTQRMRVKFFLKQKFAKEKAPETFRIFAFGGSATYGYRLEQPTEDAYVYQLARLLDAQMKNRKVEVVNWGGIQYASYRLVGLAEEGVAYAPDLVVLMAGNNEFLEARHYADFLEQQSLFTRLGHQFRISHLVAEVSNRLGAIGEKAADNPYSREFVLAPEVLGERYVIRDAEEYRLTLEHYTWNLGRMADLYTDLSIPVVLVTVPTNLRDWSPFYTANTPGGLSRYQMEARLAEVVDALSNAEPDRALSMSREVLRAEPRAAAFHYTAAQALDALHRTSEARVSYLLAKNTDAFPHRTLSSFNDAVRELAKKRGLLLLDAEQLFEAASPDGIPGKNLFLDQCHPNKEGHRLIAEGLIELVVPELI